MKFRYILIVIIFLTSIIFFQNFDFNKNHSTELGELSSDLTLLLNQTGVTTESSIPPSLVNKIKNITSVCLSESKNKTLMDIINEHYKAGNTGPAIGFLIQNFRISRLALDLEKKFNQDCQTIQCRQILIKKLSESVSEPRAFLLMFEAQYYPRVFHIENIPNVRSTPVQTAKPPKRLAWMTDEFFNQELTEFHNKNPTISDDYSTSTGQHRWRETNAQRQFPKQVGYQNHGYLLQNNKDFFEYSFCDDDPESSYSPNFWPTSNGFKAGMKTYLGCHGINNFYFSDRFVCPSAERYCENGKLLSKFELTIEETKCFQQRLFNPNLSSISKPTLVPSPTKNKPSSGGALESNAEVGEF